MSVSRSHSEPVRRSAGGVLAQVAYHRGDVSELQGDLEAAARWFRRAVEAGRADAAYRLGDVLGRLADQGQYEDESELLLAEATRWLAEAQSAPGPDAIEMITDMLNRHQRHAARRAFEPAFEAAGVG